MVDDFLATLEVGCFVALYFDNYDKEPVIGKVLSIEENRFQVHYWKGTGSLSASAQSPLREFN